jgi:hypothetical protein
MGLRRRLVTLIRQPTDLIWNPTQWLKKGQMSKMREVKARHGGLLRLMSTLTRSCGNHER